MTNIKRKLMEKLFSKTIILFSLLLLVSGCGPNVNTVPSKNTPTQPEPTVISDTLSPSNNEGVIAFYSNRDGNAEIYTINSDGTNLQRLTHNSTDDMAPAISPDGQKIAFMSARDIYVMNSDGTQQQRLTNTPDYDSHPDWSPDGTQIAFTSERDGNWEIYIMGSDGSNVQRLTNNSAQDMRPSWSPDGTRIAFSRKLNENWEIYVLDIDDALQSPDVEGNLLRLTESENGDVSPAWSPDGSQIVYMSSPRIRSFEIRVMNADGSNDHPLPGIGQINEDPAWSPDGTKIVFQSNRDGNWEIYIMDVDGSNQQRLTNNPAGDYWPSWGP
jgi:TolB protein